MGSNGNRAGTNRARLALAGTAMATAVAGLSVPASAATATKGVFGALNDGTKIEADKTYVVCGWATVGSKSPGRPIWEVVADYLREQKTVKIKKLNTPKLKNVEGNPGIFDYPA